MTITEVLQKVQLVDGKFTTYEAAHIISALIDQKINFHKLQRLKVCEGNMDSDVRYPNERIAELEAAKKQAKEFLSRASSEGYSVRIDGILNVSFEEGDDDLSVPC